MNAKSSMTTPIYSPETTSRTIFFLTLDLPVSLDGGHATTPTRPKKDFPRQDCRVDDILSLANQVGALMKV